MWLAKHPMESLMKVDRAEELRDLKARAYGRWPSILTACGVDSEILTRRNKPCPLCRNGRDRFTFDDKNGNGDYYCRKCGAGDGFNLLMKCLGIDFIEAEKRVGRAIGDSRARSKEACGGRSNRGLRELAQKIWNESKPLEEGDEAMRYLQGRGIRLSEMPITLRLHPQLGYYVTENGKTQHVADYPALIALVQDPSGGFVTVHRTYLHDGRKARGHESKKLLSGGLSAGAIRLYEHTEELGIAEGIETCLAVRQHKRQPIWAAVNCRNLEVLVIPEGVKSVHIYADNDSDSHFDGQASAFSLAKRLVNEARRKGMDRKVRVYVPRKDGQDWCDVLTSANLMRIT